MCATRLMGCRYTQRPAKETAEFQLLIKLLCFRLVSMPLELLLRQAYPRLVPELQRAPSLELELLVLVLWLLPQQFEHVRHSVF